MNKKFYRALTFGISLMLAGNLTVSAQKVTFNGERVSLKQAFEKIESVSKYKIAYNASQLDVSKMVVLNQKNKEVIQILEELLAGSGCTYKINNNYIVISPQQKKAVKQVEGVVKDATGEPVIGATIMEKSTSNGTITDFNGKFVLNVPDGAELEVSYIGYTSQRLVATAGKVLSVTLKEDTEVLDEVVVVGYGTQKKVNVVGSIAMVDSKQLENRATSSVVSALTGQMAGVTITQPGGSPGQNTGTIRVRGVGSFGATPDALILIDGIPGNMTDISPSDIESISILKDAATAAIYGARAANGVVLVTTKMGKKEKVQVSYNGYVGLNRATALPEYVDSWDYARLVNEAEGTTQFTDEEIRAMRDGSMPDRFANEKPVDDIFSGNGFQTGHDLSLNGGNEKTQYFASFGYLSQNGIIPGNNYTRYTGRVNLTTLLSDNLKLTIRLRGDRRNVDEPSTAGSIDGDGMLLLVQQGIRFPGYKPNKLTSGNWGPGYNNTGSAEAWLNSGSFVEKPTVRLNTAASLDYTPLKGLKLSVMGAYNFQNDREKTYRATLPVEIDGNISILGPSSLNEKSENTEYKSFQATANYTTSFGGKHNIDALLGYSWEDQSARDLNAQRYNFPNNNYPFLSVGSPDVQTNGGGGNDWVIQSYFGRFQYNFMERYLAEVTMRYDGSSRFPKNSRFAFFPSAALGWRISEENFIKNNEKLDFITNLKLKASVGMLGNNNIGNYAYQSVYQLGNDYNYPFGGVVNQGAALVNYTDPDLKWETTRTFDIGFESTLWNGLLSANITYFNRYTYDILYKPNASASAIFGLSMNEVNTGEASNRGWEFEVGHRNSIGAFSYGVNANFSIINNKVETLGLGNVNQPNGMIGNGSDLFLNYPMQMYYGYLTDGVFLDQADIDAWYANNDQSKLGLAQSKAKPGDIRYKDISGPDGVPDGQVDPTYDRVYLGSKIPKYTFGLSLNAAYKGFDLNMLLQGVAGVKGMLSGFSGWALYSEGNIQKWQMEEAFDSEHPTRYPKYPRIEKLNGTGPNVQTSDFWVRDASYLRVKNVQLGYTLPQSVLKRSFISNVRFYVAAENPLTFHKYPEGWDPEINSSGSFYPILANYTFGVNLKF